MKKRHRYLAFLLMVWCAASCVPQQPVPGEQEDSSRIMALRRQARVYEEAGDTDNALRYHQQALDISRESSLEMHEARSLVDLALLMRHADTDKSMDYLRDALHIARSINHAELQADIHLAIAETHKRQQNYREALVAIETHHRIIDSLLKQDMYRREAQMKAEGKSKTERGIGITAFVFLLAIAAILAYHHRKGRKANQELRRLISVRDKLFSIIGHDLRGPAGSLMQSLELMDTRNLAPADQKQLIAALYEQSVSLYETLESMFLWAGSQLNGILPAPVRFSPAELIEKNIQLLEGQASSKGLRVESQVSGDLSVYADPDHFHFTVRNLLSNAIKFSHNGGLIRIAAYQDHQIIICSVADEGTGIPAERLHAGLAALESTFGTSGEKGIGLGLQQAREYVVANGGRIWLDSQEGKGTTVNFSLPAAGKE